MAKRVHRAFLSSDGTTLGAACADHLVDDSKWMLAEDLNDVDCRHCLNGAAGNGIRPPVQPEFWAANPDLAVRFGAIDLILPTNQSRS